TLPAELLIDRVAEVAVELLGLVEGGAPKDTLDAAAPDVREPLGHAAPKEQRDQSAEVVGPTGDLHLQGDHALCPRRAAEGIGARVAAAGADEFPPPRRPAEAPSPRLAADRAPLPFAALEELARPRGDAGAIQHCNQILKVGHVWGRLVALRVEGEDDLLE